MRASCPLFAVALLAATTMVKADQECVRGTVVFQNEKFEDYLSVNADFPFINNYITKEMLDGKAAMAFDFARMIEEPCLAAATCAGGFECVSYKSARNENWYMAGAVGFRTTPQFYEANVPSASQLSWCKVTGLTGTTGTVSLKNLASQKFLSSTAYSMKMMDNAKAQIAKGGSTWIPHFEVCCEGGSFLCGDGLGDGEGGAQGDPHVRTWNGRYFDFQGACDLALVQNPFFANALGMHIHIRTKIESWWSYIETVAVRIGENTLEVMGGTESISYWINGERMELANGRTALGDFAVEFDRISADKGRAAIDLGDGDAIIMTTYKHFVRVHLKAKNAAHFEGSAGLMGTYPDGKLMARNMTTIFQDTDDFSQEWQILPKEPMLFHSSPFPDESTGEMVWNKIRNLVGTEDENVHRMQCAMPLKTRTGEDRVSTRRRLGESSVTKDDATLACANAPEHEKRNCVFDVLATNDLGIAGTY